MLPLAVDLDGTLARTDTLHEQVMRLLHVSPLSLLKLPLWLLSGRARFKRRLAETCTLDPALLPYQQDFVESLQEQASAGRKLVLATAADGDIARGVAAHLGLFDEVLASDGERNLKGEHKAEALVKRFGEGGFTYAGNSSADLEVWKRSGGAVLVNASPRTKAGVQVPVEGEFGGSSSKLAALVKAMRVYQWVKNILVFLPMCLAHDVSVDLVVKSTLMFVAFCATASGVYLLNDLTDLEDDRVHRRKRKRPFASGDLPLSFGLLGPALVIVGAGLAATLSAAALVILSLYIVTAIVYSAKAKTVPLVDVFILASLFTIRLYAGAVATDVPVSVWLLGFSSFLFLSLAFLKRCAELANRKDEGASSSRRGYVHGDVVILQTMGVGAAFVASLVLSLYVDTDVAKEFYALPTALWLVVPLLLFWQCRMWLSAARGRMTDDPIVFAAKDAMSWAVVVAAGVVVMAAVLGIPGI